MMTFEHSRIGSSIVVSLGGRIDAQALPVFDNHIQRLLDAGESSFIIDFEDVAYLSSAGLRGLLKLTKETKARGGKTVIASANDSIQHLFKISGFDKIFTIAQDLVEATGMVL
jgi:anti-anti-sigma factor